MIEGPSVTNVHDCVGHASIQLNDKQGLLCPLCIGELLVSHSVSVRKITITSDQVTGGDKNVDLVYMNPRVLYSFRANHCFK